MGSRAERLQELRSLPGFRRAAPRNESGSVAWSRVGLSGRLVELSGVGAMATLTAAMGLVYQAQQEGEPVVWIELPGSSFYPPDVADSGVDLAALAVVRTPGGGAAAKVADRLLRSGAFGLMVLDLGGDGHISTAQQGRLVGLAQKHDAAVLCLTEKSGERQSIGSMVSLRAEATRVREVDGSYRCALRVIKDKRRGPGWQHTERVRGPTGLH